MTLKQILNEPEVGPSAASGKRLPQIVEASTEAPAPERRRACGSVIECFSRFAAMWSAQSRAARAARQSGAGQTPGLDKALILLCVCVLLVSLTSALGLL